MHRNSLLTTVLTGLCCSGAQAGDLSSQVQARLLTPLASYSPAGTAFRARVTGPVLHGSTELLRPGTVIAGLVRRGHPVRFGIRAERASLELKFTGCESAQGVAIPCTLELVAVDNARESVLPGNRVRGILAASHPHSWLNGVWYRPAPAFAQRSAAGLIGTVGVIQNHLAANPATAGIVVASRLFALRMPDPEIELPAGTDLILRVTSGGQPEEDRRASPVPEVSPELKERLRELPAAITRPDGTAVQDILNLAFAGSQENVERAFGAAGWTAADPQSTRSLVRIYAAVAGMKTYETLPVSPLTYAGRLPDLVFQKSLNSVSKRHHIRLWREDLAGGTVWVAAATHDTAVGFIWSRVKVTHRIDPALDKERSKVVNDLLDAGCVANFSVVQREHLARPAGGSADVVTDGGLYLAQLQDCQKEQLALPLPKMHRNLATRSIRRVVLETRYYVMRGNVFYWGFQGVRWVAGGRRGAHDQSW